MKIESHAHFAFALQNSTTRAFTIDWLVGRSPALPYKWHEIALVEDDYARLEVLGQAIATSHKEQARMGPRKHPTGLYFWVKYRSRDFLKNRREFMSRVLVLREPFTGAESFLPDLSLFPPGSWAIQVHFTLRKPYISKDDVDFYILDNPVKKEWVFKVPYVAPSQWKGALRSAMMRMLVKALRSGQMDEAEFTNERLRLYRLFGNEKDGTAEFLNRALTIHRVGPQPADEQQPREWEGQYKRTYEQVAREFEKKVRDEGYRTENVEGFQGRLHFFPTFFNRIGLEVINPHDRKTGAGKQPIYFECVPAGTEGVFTLLYVPGGQVGRRLREEVVEEAKADLKAVAHGIRAMLTEYGFGAKTSSGYGVASVNEEEKIIKVRGFPEAEKIFRDAWNAES